jgi:hypothetical protein
MAGAVGLLRAACLILALGAAPAAAQPAQAPVPLDHLPALKGGYFRIESRAVGRPYHVYVRLPEKYGQEPGKRYPVVYLLDGDSLFPMLAPTHLFLTYDEGLEDAVVVGIAYGGFDPAINRRSVDYAAPAPGVPADQAGAPAFHRFLKGELLPRIEREYRVDPQRRVLVGQSRGAGFVLYSAFTDPDLFWGRIASNPATRPERPQFFQPPARGRRDDLGLVVVSGSRDRPHLRADALEWFAAWRGRTGTPWRLKIIDLEGGTHAASMGAVYRAGMLWLFQGRDVPAPRPAEPAVGSPTGR